MNFAIAEHTSLLIDTTARFIREELAPLEDVVETSGVLADDDAQRIHAKSLALGLYATNIPSEFGGGGLSAVETCLLEEQFGWTTDILIRRAFGNVYEVLLECSETQRERWLLPTVRGERTCAIAITEPGAGSDAAGISTRAVKESKGWRLNGAKHFISDAKWSDFFVVSAVTEPSAGAKGISLFLVDKNSTGFSLGRDQPMMGLRGTPHMELFFDDVYLDDECLLGQPGGGMRLILTTLGRVRLAQIGARAIGKATRALDVMTRYAAQREQFEQPIGNFQMIGQMLADSAMDIESARLLLLKAAWEVDQGHDARTKISMVKVHAAEALGRVVDRAVQIHGGMGYCKDLSIERLYRDARIYRIYDGTSEIHRGVIARELLKNGIGLVTV